MAGHGGRGPIFDTLALPPTQVSAEFSPLLVGKSGFSSVAENSPPDSKTGVFRDSRFWGDGGPGDLKE